MWQVIYGSEGRDTLEYVLSDTGQPRNLCSDIVTVLGDCFECSSGSQLLWQLSHLICSTHCINLMFRKVPIATYMDTW